MSIRKEESLELIGVLQFQLENVNAGSARAAATLLCCLMSLQNAQKKSEFVDFFFYIPPPFSYTYISQIMNDIKMLTRSRKLRNKIFNSKEEAMFSPVCLSVRRMTQKPVDGFL